MCNITALQRPHRTVHQIVDKDGKPYQATVTSNLWMGDEGRFANKTEGNRIEAYVSGRSYFTALVEAFRVAQKQICIAGWQISWDALVAPDTRLYDVLYEAAAANRSLMIYVMPWNDTEPVQTFDEETKLALEDINERLKRVQVHVLLSPSYAPVNHRFFSHHQKQVVIDGRIAFVGGIDICYGRYDDQYFEVTVENMLRREGLNRYNPCVHPTGTVDRSKAVDPDYLSGLYGKSAAKRDPWRSAYDGSKKLRAGGWQVKYESAGLLDVMDNAGTTATNKEDFSTLDSQEQPRMPWQDVHCRIEGPAVDDLLRNFVGRWNIVARRRRMTDAERHTSDRPPKIVTPGDWRLPMPGRGDAATCAQPKVGNVDIQVLRSAPALQCEKENDPALPHQLGKPRATQCDIYCAMLILIEKAIRFIYIENQFFVSNFGQEAKCGDVLSPAAQYINIFGDGDQQSTAQWSARVDKKSRWSPRRPWLRNIDAATGTPTNLICQALIDRICRSIDDRDQPPFHVYITLPVHPEGKLSDASIAVQVYFTMQTIAFGSQSLLTGIRRRLKARELRDAKDPDCDRVLRDANTEYESIPIERCWDYVTLLNLRNWGSLHKRYITEQVYVHSKCMIVDDRYALLGSASINDRSLLGSRDSELAVLVMDGDTKNVDTDGEGAARPVRMFAHELRKSLWRKIFGFGTRRAASELAQAIDEPGNPRSWKAIQQRARENAEIYEAVFPWVPRNFKEVKGKHVPASILPTWNWTSLPPSEATWEQGNLESAMPFQREFWDTVNHNKAAEDRLSEIKGYITALPVDWTRGENIHFDFSTALVAGDERPAGVQSNFVVSAKPDASEKSVG